MKRLWIAVFLLGCFTLHNAQEMLTTAESSNYSRTSTYEEVMRFIERMSARSSGIRLARLAVSTEGRTVPLVIISREGIATPRQMRMIDKPAVFINANIHGGEVEGKEVCQMLIRDAANRRLDHLLQNQIILICPIFNPDGNERFGPNRHDNGPEFAGNRANGQGLDLNRDFLKLETPEISGMIDLLNRWDPILFVDIHTTNGSYHREPVTYTTMSHPDSDADLREFMWQKFFPAARRRLADQYRVDSVPYGNFVDRFNPEKGWINWALDARFGFNYIGLRNRFTILNENYSRADFQTRTMGCYAFMHTILQTSAELMPSMRSLVRRVDMNTRDRYFKASSALVYKTVRLMDIHLKSYTFEKVPIPPDERSNYPAWYGNYRVVASKPLRDYTLPYLAKPAASKEIDLPMAYLILPQRTRQVQLLRAHGIIVERVVSKVSARVQRYAIDSLEPENRIYQGRVLIKVTAHLEETMIDIPIGTAYISLRQSLARLIPVLLEPESPDSLLRWGFFNRDIVSQWSSRSGTYPVYRIAGLPAGAVLKLVD